jgi:hypothetical protein
MVQNERCFRSVCLFGQIKLSGWAVSGQSFVLWTTEKTHVSLTVALQAAFPSPLSLCPNSSMWPFLWPGLAFPTVQFTSAARGPANLRERITPKPPPPSLLAPRAMLGKWARICDVLLTILSKEPNEILRGDYYSYQHQSFRIWRCEGSDMKSDAA